MMTLDSRVRQHPDTVACDMDGEMVILDMQLDKYFGLNPAASLLWNQLQKSGTPSIAELCDALEARYAATRAQCEADTLALIGQLLERGLVEQVTV
jgi:hypothetical protein